MYDRRVRASLLVLVGVLLALAGPVAGGMKATFSTGGVGAGDAAAALRRLMSARLEDGVAPELAVDLELHRPVLTGGYIDYSTVMEPGSPACLGQCGARGQQYSGRGCNSHYRCPNGPP